jgi:hypothetical protein
MLLNGPQIYYRLKIVDLDASFEYSKTILINSKTLENSVLISPNPSNGIFNFNLGSDLISEEIRIDIFNVKGQLVHQEMIKNANQSFHLDLSHLSEGVYISQINTNNEMISKRLIKK